MNIYEKLLTVQQKLKAPKNQFNSFGKYNYRSCEDILEGLKPILSEVKAIVMIDDTVQLIGDRYYIEAKARFIDIEDGKELNSTAYAREDNEKKGMDLAQVTGSVSSYARKYALNGLFCIDDTKDSDNTNTGDKGKNEDKADKPAELISEPQAKRFFALGKGNVELVKKVLLAHGYTESKNVKKSDYEKICKEIETQAA